MANSNYLGPYAYYKIKSGTSSVEKRHSNGKNEILHI